MMHLAMARSNARSRFFAHLWFDPPRPIVMADNLRAARLDPLQVCGSGVGAIGTAGMHFGFVQTTGGTINEAQHSSGSGTSVLPYAAALDGSVHQIAVHYAYDIGADTTTSRVFADGVEVGGAYVQAAHKPSQHTVNTAAPDAGGSHAAIGQLAGYPDWGNGAIFRVDRVFTRVPHPDIPGAYVTLDPAVHVARDFAINAPLF